MLDPIMCLYWDDIFSSMKKKNYREVAYYLSMLNAFLTGFGVSTKIKPNPDYEQYFNDNFLRLWKESMLYMVERDQNSK